MPAFDGLTSAEGTTAGALRQERPWVVRRGNAVVTRRRSWPRRGDGRAFGPICSPRYLLDSTRASRGITRWPCASAVVDANRFRGDVADPESLEAAVGRSGERFGSCELVLPNVGVHHSGRSIGSLNRRLGLGAVGHVMGTVRTFRASCPCCALGTVRGKLPCSHRRRRLRARARLVPTVPSNPRSSRIRSRAATELAPDGIVRDRAVPGGEEPATSIASHWPAPRARRIDPLPTNIGPAMIATPRLRDRGAHRAAAHAVSQPRGRAASRCSYASPRRLPVSRSRSVPASVEHSNNRMGPVTPAPC